MGGTAVSEHLTRRAFLERTGETAAAVGVGLAAREVVAHDRDIMRDLSPPRPAPKPSQTTPHLTVIPPGPVSDKIRVELRLAIPNPGCAPRTCSVRFYRDRIDPAHQFHAETVTVPPKGIALSRAWSETAGHVGRRVLRCRVESEAGRADVRWPLEVIASETRALPRLQGGWIDPYALSRTTYPRDRDLSARDVRDRLDAMRRLGMNVVIITYVEYFGHFFYPSRVEFFDRDVQRVARGERFDFDVVETILSQGDRNGMHVFLGLGRGGDTQLLWEFDHPDWPERNAEALRIGRRVATELWERYRHHRSFYGWYLTHEMSDLARASAYYNPLADVLHALSPDKPVMVAPAGTPIVTRRSLTDSRIDIFAYQDAVGAGYVPYRYTYQPEQRLRTLDEVFHAYGQAHEGTGKHLWADLEIWEMDGTRGYSGAYPSPFSRVKRQIAAEASHVELLTAYEVFGFMEPPRSRNRRKDPRSVKLWEEYQRYLRASRPPRESVRERKKEEPP
jgi:Domain of unknown function (DUF4434)